MGNQGVRNRFDLLDIEYSQVGKPAMKSEQGIVVRGEIFGQALLYARAVEHPADDWTIDVTTLDGKTDETSAEHVDNDHQPRMSLL